VLQLVDNRLLDSPACAWVCLIVGVAVTAPGCVWALLEALWEYRVIGCSVDHAALIWEAVLCHVAKHVKHVATIAAIAIAMVSTTIQQCLTGQHYIWTHALLGNLEAVLDHVSAAMRPAGPTVYWNMLVPGGCAHIVCTITAPAEVLWQSV